MRDASVRTKVTYGGERKEPHARELGFLIDVTRFIFTSQDRSTGKIVFRFRDDRGRLVALRLDCRLSLFVAVENLPDALAIPRLAIPRAPAFLVECI